MKLASVEQFRRQCFVDGSAPDPRTIRKHIRQGLIPGKIVSHESKSLYFVDVEAWQRETGNPLVDRILND